jgi:ATP-dependent DNA ligase
VDRGDRLLSTVLPISTFVLGMARAVARTALALRSMALPLQPVVLPQLARPRATLPEGDGWAYEPKWDGFRTIAFVDGAEVYLQSRNGKPMSRYFPEVAFARGRYVIDGELVAASFGTLGQRIHPALSRIERLAVETPARFVAFDVLALEDEVLLERGYAERRAVLETIAGLELTPVVYAAADARQWLQDEEGVIAKELACPYLPGERKGMVKVKRVRTIDAVVMGWRPGKEDGTVGAIILGLYDEDGRLHEVGHSSGFTAKRKRELVALRPELVVEVTYDHVSDGRIRHGTKVLRWRDDKPPGECRLEQLES